MIVDTSALIAIVQNEPEAETFAKAIDRAESARVSAATLLETSIVVDGLRAPALSRRFDRLVGVARLDVQPFTVEQAEIAREAYREYGRGSGHPAKLNFGDCFAYALAFAMNEPLLFTGDDFTYTDIKPAV